MAILALPPSMPTNDRSHPGVFTKMLEDARFVDVVVRDYLKNIKPMACLFFFLVIFLTFLSACLGWSGTSLTL